MDSPRGVHVRGERVQLTSCFIGVTRRASLPRPDTKTCAVPVWQLPGVANVEERKVSSKSGCNLTCFSCQSGGCRTIYRGRNERLGNSHFELADAKSHDQRKVHRWRSPGVEIRGQRYGCSGLDQGPCGRLFRLAEEEHGSGKECGDGRR